MSRRTILRNALAVGLVAGGTPALAERTTARQGGLVAYYPLDGTSGRVRDASGSGLNGTPLGGVARGVVGQVNSAFRFDNSDDGVEVPGGPFSLTSRWTVSAWVNPTTRGSDYRNDPIVWKIARTGQGPRGNQDTFFLGWGASNRFRTGLERASDGTDFTVDSETHPPGAWHHVAGVYDGSTLRIYVNGAVEGTNDIGNVVAPTGPAPLRIGNLLHSTHDTRGVFNGRIDEARIYDRALSSGEIQIHERLGVCGLSPSDVTRTVLNRLVAAAEAGNLRTLTDRVNGNLDVPSGSATFVRASVTGNVGDGNRNTVFVLCDGTVNGNMKVPNVVVVNSRTVGNLQAEETATAVGEVSVNGNLNSGSGTVTVTAGSSLRIDGNANADRLVLRPNATLTVNGNLNCSSSGVASSANVSVNGINNCT